MAKVKNPFMSGEASGSVGSLTASRNRSGAVMRQNASPVQPRSNSVTSKRYTMGSLVQQFQALTTAQITAWNDFATNNPVQGTFGDPVTLSGLNYFIRLNSRLVETGQSVITTPPATGVPDYQPTLNVLWDTTSNTGIDLTYSPAPATNQRIAVSYSGNVPLSRNFLSKDVKIRQYVDNSDTSPVLIIAAADIVADSQRQVLVQAIDEYGRATPKIRFTVPEELP